MWCSTAQTSGNDRRAPERACLIALVVVAVLALAAAAIHPAAAAHSAAPTTVADVEPTSDTGLRRAALRIIVRTTSDWVQVDLPGVSAGHVVVTSSGASEVQPTGRGVVVRGQAGVLRSVAVDVVTEVPPTIQQAWIVLKQGGAGSASAAIQNRTAAPYAVASLATRAGSTSTKTVSISDLMGPTQLEWARADDERRVLAFTYPWFDESAATDPLLSARPIELLRSWSGADAQRAAQLARQNGIDGFVMSWAGGREHGLALYHALTAAAETGGTATILLETVEAGSAAVAEQWIREALRQSSSPAFQRLDGVPVVFVFDAGVLPKAEWRGISDRLAASGTPVRLIGDIWDGQGGAITGMYRYNALLQTETDLMTPSELTDWNRGISRALRARATLGHGDPGVVVATAQPGWDDRPLRGEDRLRVERNGVKTYDATWQAALAGEADWVVITSWNEWYEGTGIAPSAEHGDDALVATGPWAQRFGS